jgi:hypothetical protein
MIAKRRTRPTKQEPHHRPARARGLGVTSVVALVAIAAVVTAVVATPHKSASATSVVIRVNSGGSAYRDSGGAQWSADTGFVGGTASITTAGIAGTDNDPLYRSERAAMTAYNFAVPNGTYHVKLKFAEIDFTAAGKRIFDVAAEGRPVVSGLDIFAAVGANHAYVREFDTTVSDGTINLGFHARVGVAQVSAVEVRSLTVSPQPSPSTTHPTSDSTTTQSTSGPTSTAPPVSTTTPGTSSTTSASARPPVGGGYVTACGTQLCSNGAPWQLYEGSINGRYNPASAVSLATSLRLNTLRLTDWLSRTSDPYDHAAWANVDAIIAEAGRQGVRIELNLSTYRNLLLRQGVNPYTADWTTFMRFVANRVNTVNHVRYGDDPTIALLSVVGEVPPLKDTNVSADQLVAFYRSVLAMWKSSAHQLTTPGGLLQLNWNSGIPWQRIFALPDGDVCAIHVYSSADQTVTVPNVSSFCDKLGKPWMVEEFGVNGSVGDVARAQGFQARYDLFRRYHAAAVGFWNLGNSANDVNGTGFPLTQSTVRSNAP